MIGPGDVVDITIRRATVEDVLDDRRLLVRIKDVDITHTITVPGCVQVDRATPVGWPPQPGDLWRTWNMPTVSACWYAHLDGETVYPDGVVLISTDGEVISPDALLMIDTVLVWRDGGPV